MTCAFSSSLTTTVFSQRSMRRFDVSPRRATPKGHNLHHLHSTASRRPPYIRTPLRAHGAPKLIPALIAGCTVVVKPAPETPLDALWLAEMLEQIDLPEGVVSIIPGGRETGESLVRHPGVDKISFTGSSATGRRIAALCGEQLKRVSLELGGKSAAIILDDADLDHTVKGLKTASLMNNGQACVAQTRVLVSERRHDEVVDALAEMMSGLQVGDPADDATDVGPLVAQRQQHRVQGLHPRRARRRRADRRRRRRHTVRPRLVRPAHIVHRARPIRCALPAKRSSVPW